MPTKVRGLHRITGHRRILFICDNDIATVEELEVHLKDVWFRVRECDGLGLIFLPTRLLVASGLEEVARPCEDGFGDRVCLRVISGSDDDLEFLRKVKPEGSLLACAASMTYVASLTCASSPDAPD